MRSRAQSAEQAETVSRRLRLLSAELNAIRPAATEPPGHPLPEVAAGEELPDDGHTHLRELRVVDEPVAADEAGTALPLRPAAPLGPAPDLPVPGRHAARRAVPSWFDVSPLRGRVSLNPSALAVLAVLVAIGLGVTAWWVIRDDPGVPVSAPTTGTALATPDPTGGTPPEGAATPDPGAESDDVVVDVAGKVRDPGIVVLPAGSRVVDALKAAGGVRRGADLTGLNRARIVQDGEQIVVGVPAPPGLAASAAPSAAAGAGDLVSLNTATATELEELPGVGPVTASKIIDWREANGGFANVDQLLEVDGIGEKTLAELAPHVTL